MRIDDVMRQAGWKARINSVKKFLKRPYDSKEKAFDLMILKMHVEMRDRDVMSHYIEDMIRKRLQRYED